MNNRKVYLFLDVDGVLNCKNSFMRDYENKVKFDDLYHDMNKSNLLCLKYFTKHTPNLSIVLSSSWRQIPSLREKLRRVFEDMDIPMYIGITPYISGYKVRGKEIQQWMDEHGIDKNDIVIFDDEACMNHLMDRLVKTSFQFGGLQYHHLKQAWKKLNMEEPDHVRPTMEG